MKFIRIDHCGVCLAIIRFLAFRIILKDIFLGIFLHFLDKVFLKQGKASIFEEGPIFLW